ncbi:hypothetical protein EDB83DRAFT_839188 [Lactarius deliciosus]|nr:hypothetical protein EDB83DRAFT_839188 [Lactarius deliciosus]
MSGEEGGFLLNIYRQSASQHGIGTALPHALRAAKKGNPFRGPSCSFSTPCGQQGHIAVGPLCHPKIAAKSHCPHHASRCTEPSPCEFVGGGDPAGVTERRAESGGFATARAGANTNGPGRDRVQTAMARTEAGARAETRDERRQEAMSFECLQ